MVFGLNEFMLVTVTNAKLIGFSVFFSI